jgi:hypothetical protein
MSGSALPAGPRVADALRAALAARSDGPLPPHHWKALRAVLACRTPALGGHRHRCGDCGREHFVPHSCRNRHCPTCQGGNAGDWLQQQSDSLLPIPYFHVVFTLPHALNPLLRQNQAALYRLLFDTAARTLLEFGENHLKARIGLTAVLHTWSQTLLDHYHLHCIVTGGGLREDGTWRPVKPYWLFPVRALAKVFRAKFRDGLATLAPTLELHGQIEPLRKPRRFGRFLRDLGRPKWVVYAKRPFAGPEQVLAYLARYTHRVGLTDRRIRRVDPHTVTFVYKDYADGAKQKETTLAHAEFLRRFRLHLLPPRFVKIRHYGLLGNRLRQRSVAQARHALQSIPPTPPKPASPRATPSKVAVCTHCQSPRLILVAVVPPSRRPLPFPCDSS